MKRIKRELVRAILMGGVRDGAARASLALEWGSATMLDIIEAAIAVGQLTDSVVAEKEAHGGEWRDAIERALERWESTGGSARE